jgi:XisI protein
MATQTDVVKEVVFSYATAGLKLRTLALSNEEQDIYAVIVINWPERHRPAGVVVLARVEGDQVIIEEDLTDRPLVEALVSAGIPPEQIILRYAEQAPTNKHT